jgi:hypothetical protein
VPIPLNEEFFNLSFTLVDGSPRPGKQSITNEHGKIICTFRENSSPQHRRLMAISPRLLAYCVLISQSYESALLHLGADAAVIESLPTTKQLREILAEITTVIDTTNLFVANNP